MGMLQLEPEKPGRHSQVPVKHEPPVLLQLVQAGISSTLTAKSSSMAGE